MVYTDNFPSETTIQVCSSTECFLEAESYYQSLFLHSYTLDYLPANTDITFTITDSYGDGLNFGPGFYEITDALGSEIGRGYDFEYSETVIFQVSGCVPSTCFDGVLTPGYCQGSSSNSVIVCAGLPFHISFFRSPKLAHSHLRRLCTCIFHRLIRPSPPLFQPLAMRLRPLTMRQASGAAPRHCRQGWNAQTILNLVSHALLRPAPTAT